MPESPRERRQREHDVAREEYLATRDAAIEEGEGDALRRSAIREEDLPEGAFIRDRLPSGDGIPRPRDERVPPGMIKPSIAERGP